MIKAVNPCPCCGGGITHDSPNQHLCANVFIDCAECGYCHDLHEVGKGHRFIVPVNAIKLWTK